MKVEFFCPFPHPPCHLSLLKNKIMAEIQTIRRNLALKEYELKETHDGKQVTFSIRFVKKNGEAVFIPCAIAAGLPFNGKDSRMRGVLPVDSENKSLGHVTPVHIDGIIEWNGKKIRM